MPENRTFQKGGNTKKLIEEAAMALFATYGYKGASVRKIAAEVGIRESALYNHFANKEAIFLAIAARAFASPFAHEYNDAQLRELALKGKPFLHRFMTEFKLMSFDKNHEKLFRFMFIELMQNDVFRMGFKKEFHDANVKILSSGFFTMMQEGLIRSEDPMVMANAFLGQMFYLRLQIGLLKADNQPTTALSTAFEKQLDLFWSLIVLK